MTSPTSGARRPYSFWPFVAAGVMTAIVTQLISLATPSGTLTRNVVEALAVAMVWVLVFTAFRLPIRDGRPRWQSLALMAVTLGATFFALGRVLDRVFPG